MLHTHTCDPFSLPIPYPRGYYSPLVFFPWEIIAKRDCREGGDWKAGGLSREETETGGKSWDGSQASCTCARGHRPSSSIGLQAEIFLPLNLWHHSPPYGHRIELHSCDVTTSKRRPKMEGGKGSSHQNQSSCETTISAYGRRYRIIASLLGRSSHILCNMESSKEGGTSRFDASCPFTCRALHHVNRPAPALPVAHLSLRFTGTGQSALVCPSGRITASGAAEGARERAPGESLQWDG